MSEPQSPDQLRLPRRPRFAGRESRSVILPNAGLPTMLPGGPKLGVIEHIEHVHAELHARAGPCSFLISDTSVLWNAGPTRALLPRLPKRSTATNTDGSNH